MVCCTCAGRAGTEEANSQHPWPLVSSVGTKKNNEQNEEEPQCEGEEEPEVDPRRTHTPAGGIRVKDRPTDHGGELPAQTDRKELFANPAP